ncbi:MAG: DNA replication and repair protein RecF [Candidatus Berkelbacteria bacterium Athens1014_28]|uniref:DNA replication and repair protein RecF n=1 Tax=Candidatus Berkelbacteria bacterium Athens1014_28 TaxID=2017145 RepID=A0A554LL57_9BACT|nr:MAG: DNA replication and repair protein RecF [Candidatus Berkelbacteria bacterium Athens1014_28]
MLQKLTLVNFRNHKKFELELGEITVLVGKNAVGKTNILESIVVLSCGRSFRGDNRLELVNFEADFTRIVGDDLELFIQKTPRFLFQVKERGIKRKPTDFIGILESVIFSPESLQIITGEPKERRRFLDILISQKDHKYLSALMEYRKVLAQRNRLLKLISESRAAELELDFWDERLAESAEIISAKRKEVVEFFNQKLSDKYQTISGQKNAKLSVAYLSRHQSNLLDYMKQRRQIEIAAGVSLFGPHRDDLLFLLNQKEAGRFASRGELRSIILALKAVELQFLENEKKPVLLLDDIFSELDAERREHLYKIIKNHQTIITTTDQEHLSGEILKKAKVVEIG